MQASPRRRAIGAISTRFSPRSNPMQKPIIALLAAIAVAGFTGAHAGDVIITATKPDRLFFIDAASRSVRTEYKVEGAQGQIFTTVVSPDQRTVYMLVDRMER